HLEQVRVLAATLGRRLAEGAREDGLDDLLRERPIAQLIQREAPQLARIRPVEQFVFQGPAARAHRSRAYAGEPAAVPGGVGDSVNVTAAEYVPVRSASPAPMCCENAIDTGSLDTGAVQLVFDGVTDSASGSENAPLARCVGPETDSAASPAVLMTFADVDAV